MIIQEFYIPKYGDWHVKVYYAVHTYWADRIIMDLYRIGCRGFPQACVSQSDRRQNEYRSNLFGLQEKRNSNGYLTNLYPRRVSKFVGPRKGHLCRHISKAFGIDPYGEEAQYLSGYVGQKMFPVAKKFLCEHCRKGLEK